MKIPRQQSRAALANQGSNASESPVLERSRSIDEAEEQVLAWLRSGCKPNSPPECGRWVEAFLTGGRAALERLIPGKDWLYLRIEPPVGLPPKELLVSAILPTLSRHIEGGGLHMYWFLLKHDTGMHIRLRMFGEVGRMRAELLPDLTRSLERWVGAPVHAPVELIYEPETALFGGAWCLERIHALFFNDSRFVLEWSTLTIEERGGISHHQISLIMQQYLQESTGLDSFEVWDVWQKVTRLRQGDAQALECVWNREKEDIELLLRVSPVSLAEALGPAAREPLERYAASIRTLGGELSVGQRTGLLERGLRQVLATSICFHWNRMGFTGEEQSALAYLMARATAPLN